MYNIVASKGYLEYDSVVGAAEMKLKWAKGVIDTTQLEYCQSSAQATGQGMLKESSWPSDKILWGLFLLAGAIKDQIVVVLMFFGFYGVWMKACSYEVFVVEGFCCG